MNDRKAVDMFKIAVILSILLVCGCSTVSTQFSETVTDPDGTTDITSYTATSIAPPLGKLDTSSHEWKYVWGGAENSIATGQSAQGLDNTGQAVIVPLLQTLVEALVKAAQAARAPVEVSLP